MLSTSALRGALVLAAATGGIVCLYMLVYTSLMRWWPNVPPGKEDE